MTKHRERKSLAQLGVAITQLALMFIFLIAGGPQLRAAQSKQTLSSKELKALIANAKEPADHERLAAYYKAQARRLLAQSKEHEEMAAAYKGWNPPNASKTQYATHGAVHCEYFAKTFREAAEKMNELAAMHEEMAKEAAK